MDILDELWKSRHEKEVLFLDIVNKCEIKTLEEFPDEIFYIMDDNIIFDYNVDMLLGINAELVFDVFESKFNLNHTESRILLKNLSETYLKMKFNGLPYNIWITSCKTI